MQHNLFKQRLITGGNGLKLYAEETGPRLARLSCLSTVFHSRGWPGTSKCIAAWLKLSG